MARLNARLVILLMVVGSAGALAAVQGSAQFGHLEIISNGSVTQLQASMGEPGADPVIRIRFTGGQEVVDVDFRRDLRAGQTVTVPVRVVDGARGVAGTATLEVEESGRFLGGQLQGQLGGYSLAGGVRIRVDEAPRDRDGSVAHRSNERGAITVGAGEDV